MFADDLDMNEGMDALFRECEECGHRQPEEYDYCQECGAKMPEETE